MFNTTTACDKDGKVLGEIKIRPNGKGCAVAEIVAHNKQKFKLMTFTRQGSTQRWTNDKTPTLCTNKQRIDAAVNLFYFSTDLMKKVADLSGYDTHNL